MHDWFHKLEYHGLSDWFAINLCDEYRSFGNRFDGFISPDSKFWQVIDGYVIPVHHGNHQSIMVLVSGLKNLFQQ